jgi:hypothetical protein
LLSCEENHLRFLDKTSDEGTQDVVMTTAMQAAMLRTDSIGTAAGRRIIPCGGD